jgi:hypothetical protein
MPVTLLGDDLKWRAMCRDPTWFIFRQWRSIISR